ncbi:MAG: Ppx/GppA family phosphatase [Rhizobiaceae bacterium]|nr:Ppx/GppA family phosphatase [Rhizobiaceae bacterium]
MSNPPHDAKAFVAGSSHFSGRRLKRRKSGNSYSVDANSGTEDLAKSGHVRPATGPVGSPPTMPPNCGREEYTDKKLANSQNTMGTAETVSGQQGIGRGSNVANRNRRPGRREKQNSRNIEYPQKFHPHSISQEKRQHSQSSLRNQETVAGSSSRQPHWSEVKKIYPLYAALDLGTNNCRLLVAQPQQVGRFRVVDAFSRIVRLGKGLENSGRLDDDAMGRAVEALGECADKLQNKNISKVRLIATEACRRASNGVQFLERVKQETGLKLEIVNRETEAYLAAEGCGALVDKKADGAVLFDIGGGSSELILLDRRKRRGKKISKQISAWTSLPVGVVTLSERHGGKHVSKQMFDEMVEEVEQHLKKFEGRECLEEFWHTGRVHLLGTSGTVTTLAGVHLKLPRYDRRQVDGIWLRDHQVDRVIEQLVEMEYHQRAQNPCIGTERADLVLAGCAILQAIRNNWPSPRLRVADRGLREGILTQMMNQDGAWISKKRQSQSSKGRSNNSANSRGMGRKSGRDNGNG